MAAGKLLGLDAEGLRNALALALIPNLCTYQTRAGELSMWKGCASHWRANSTISSCVSVLVPVS